MKNKLIAIVFLLLFCSIISPNSLKAETSNRIISLIPSSTEMLFSIGFGREIIAVSNYCNYPSKEIEGLPRIGDQNLNIEKILSLKPTILVDTNGIHKRYEELFQKLKLNYLNLSIKSIEDVPLEASRLAEILGDKTKADDFIKKWNLEISKLTTNNDKKIPSIYMEIWNNPIQAVGGNNIMNSIILAAGGENVLAKQNDYPVINSEILMVANPDIIILAYPDADIESVKKRPGWKIINAVKNNRVFSINQDTIVRPGPRNIEAIREINKFINKVEEK